MHGKKDLWGRSPHTPALRYAPLQRSMLLLLSLVMLLAGPSAAEESTVRFAVIGDYGMAGTPEQDVATLVHSWNPDLILTLGDNNYPDGAATTIDANIGQFYHDYIGAYIGMYGPGASTPRFFPSLGNHDWVTPEAAPYRAYFTLPGNERYYTFTRGTVQFFALDSDPAEPDGITSDSPQAHWLHAELAASDAVWKVVYFHHPPYSSGPHGSNLDLQWPFQAWGASLVLAGHDHLYERIMQDGFPYVVNGLGGVPNIYEPGPPVPGSVIRYNSDFGAMLVEASSDALTFAFITRAGLTIDRYTIINVPVKQRAYLPVMQR